MPRRIPDQPRPRCQPYGSLAPHPLDGPDACACRQARVCRRCGVALFARPSSGGTDWYYVDSNNSAYGQPPALEDKIQGKKLPPGVHDAYDLLDFYVRTDDIESYSMLQIALTSEALRTHQHDPASTTCVSSDHPVPPWCCDSPMYLAPRGWQCRTRKTWFPFAAG